MGAVMLGGFCACLVDRLKVQRSYSLGLVLVVYLARFVLTLFYLFSTFRGTKDKKLNWRL